MNTWHATPQDLATYRSGAATPLLASSVEAHLIGCGECRAALAETPVPGSEHSSARRWAAVSAAVDAGSTSPLLRLGVATRPLLTALGVATLLLVALPLTSSLLAGEYRVATALLASAPLAPMVAVAFAYRRETDPVGEISLAAPVAGIRLVAHRALLVAVASVPLAVAGGLLLDVPPGAALGWLLPGLAMAGLVLLAGTTRLDPALTAAVLGALWAVGVTSAARRGTSALVVDLVAAVPTQATALVVAVLAFTLAFARRDRLSYRRFL